MFSIFNEMAQKAAQFINAQFPEKIYGEGINLGPGTSFHSTLQYAVHENRETKAWDVVAIHKSIPHLSSKICSVRVLPVASLPSREEALAHMNALEPRLWEHAPLILQRMGIKNPAESFPILANRGISVIGSKVGGRIIGAGPDPGY